jgi:hypothetical protein
MSPFSASYREARNRFLEAASAAGAIDIRPYLNANRGPEAEVLGTDVAWIGPRDAAKVVVSISATHGVEGFLGSALQVDWLTHRREASLPAGVAALHIHALNPHGFAWLRRVTEEGIDLNRNFIDFARPLPANPGYDELHPHLIEAPNDAAIEAYRAQHGQRALEIAVSGGQYSHPDGLFYGGRAPAWSRLTVEAIIRDFGLTKRTTVAVLDLHTGLGPFGVGEVICDHPTGSPELVRGKRWFGSALTEPALGTSTSVPKAGLLDYGWMNALGPAVTFVTLEFGTFPVEEMFRQLRADHILHRTGLPDWQAPATRVVKDALRHHFCPDDESWRQMILTRGREVFAQAEQGVAAEAA